MAEIRIEKRPSPWPWILGVLALALVGWMVFATLGDDGRETETQQAVVQGEPGGMVGTSGGAVPAAVQDYSAFAEDSGRLSPGREHEYTAEGIRRLSAALGAFVDQNAGDAESRSRFDRFRQSADRLQQEPQSSAHANTVRQVFTSAVDVMESGAVNAGDVSELRETAASLSPDQPLLEQTEKVKRFFSQSAEALRRAAQRS